MGKFHPEYEKRQQELDDQFAVEAQAIAVGQRCQVRIDETTQAKRGVVCFVGKTDFKPGYWVGVEYDEPIGKHDGRYTFPLQTSVQFLIARNLCSQISF